MEVLPVHIAVLTIADDAASADRATAQAISETASTAGHEIVDEEIAKDNESAIRDQLVRWISEDNIDVVIVAAGVDSEAASAALAPLVHQTLPGFTDLFRWLTFQEIGASAMLSAAEAAQCQSTFVFVLPAHEGAVRAAMTKLILPQLDVRTKPKNLVTQMPRLKDAAKKLIEAHKSQPVAASSQPVAVPSQPVAVPSQPVAMPGQPVSAPLPSIVPQAPIVAAPPPEAVPMPITAEKTAGGSGLAPKLPARNKPRTANTIARQSDDPPTKPIDLAKLEKQIALSNQNDSETKQVDLQQHDAKTKVVDMSAHQAKTRVVDSGRVLPRVPPGADASALDADEDEALTFRAPSSTPRPKPPTGQHAIVKPIGVVKSSGGTTPGTQAPVSRELTTPSFATPVSRKTPPAAYQSLSTPLSSRSTVRTPPATPIVPQRPHSPSSAPLAPQRPQSGSTPPVSPPRSQSGSTPPLSPPRSQSGSTPPLSPQRSQSASTPPSIAPQRSSTSTAMPSPVQRPPAAVATPQLVTPQPATPQPLTPREEVLTPETPVIALRQASTTSPPPVTTPAGADEAVTSPGRPTPQPNAAELWARAITPASGTPTHAEPVPVEAGDAEMLEADDVVDEPAATDESAATDAPSPISTLFANQPPSRKRPPTPPPAHIETLGRPLPHAPDILPEGDFAYPLKRSGSGLLLKIIIALAVMAAGFFAFTKLYPTDEPTKTASVTPPPTEPTPPPAPVVETPAVDAQPAVAEPDVNVASPTPPVAPVVETPADAAKPTDTKPKSTSETKPKSTSDGAHDTKPKSTSEGAHDTKPKSTTDTKPKSTDTKPKEGETTETTPVSSECDEVSCIMTKYERACCLRYKPTDGFTPKNVIPDGLDKAMVKAGVETVKPRIVACGEQNGAKGTVRLAVSVDDAGTVTSVSVTESPDTALGECVAAAMKKAKFGKSVNGGDFNYPFVF